MKSDFNQLHKQYVQNIKMFPVLLQELSNQLGASITSLGEAEVGLCPMSPKKDGTDIANWSWTFPERDENDNIIGLTTRLLDGSKYMIEGSKRGLTYIINKQSAIQYERNRWARVSKEYPCPICGKADGCMYPEGEYDKPNAVTCVHISEGSLKPTGLGYLHKFDSSGKRTYCKQGFNPRPDLPILIVEGASDVCAAYDIGLSAVGRPSAQGGNKLLVKFLPKTHKIVIIGENDAGVGKTGMESAFAVLRKQKFDCVKLLPPTNIKDLRQWVNAGLTQKELLDYIEASGDNVDDPNIFETDVALKIAKSWLRQTKTIDGHLLLRLFQDNFYEYVDGHYEQVSKASIEKQLYVYVEDKSYIDTASAIKPYKITGAKMRDLIHACGRVCLVEGVPPIVLNDNAKLPEPNNLIVFQNGILDVQSYFDGNPVLQPPTPDLFILNVVPYDYNPNARSDLYEEFINSIFNDEESIRTWNQWYGYNVVHDSSLDKFMMLIGPTRSGKSTLIDVLRQTIGLNQCMSTDFSTLANKHGTAPLEHKLAATIGDVRMPPKVTANLALNTILKITGNDAIPIRQLYKEQREAVLGCRFTIGMNNLPSFSDNARAFLARALILNLPNSFLGREDTTLKRKLEAEAASGKLINYALDGLKDLRQQGYFTVPKSSEPFIEELEEITAPVSTFVKQHCDVDVNNPEWFTPKDIMFSAWRCWCEKTNRTVGNLSYFSRFLYHACPGVVDKRVTVEGRRGYVFMGIKLQDWVYSEYM